MASESIRESSSALRPYKAGAYTGPHTEEGPHFDSHVCNHPSLYCGARHLHILWAKGTCPRSACASFYMRLWQFRAHSLEWICKHTQACCVDSSSCGHTTPSPRGPSRRITVLLDYGATVSHFWWETENCTCLHSSDTKRSIYQDKRIGSNLLI